MFESVWTLNRATEQALTVLEVPFEWQIRQFIRRVAYKLYTFIFLWGNRLRNQFREKSPEFLQAIYHKLSLENL